jgi:hypothetical protein
VSKGLSIDDLARVYLVKVRPWFRVSVFGFRLQGLGFGLRAEGGRGRESTYTNKAAPAPPTRGRHEPSSANHTNTHTHTHTHTQLDTMLPVSKGTRARSHARARTHTIRCAHTLPLPHTPRTQNHAPWSQSASLRSQKTERNRHLRLHAALAGQCVKLTFCNALQSNVDNRVATLYMCVCARACWRGARTALNCRPDQWGCAHTAPRTRREWPCGAVGREGPKTGPTSKSPLRGARPPHQR